MEKLKTAFITGISGQDGSYLAEYLWSIGYIVYGTAKSLSNIPIKTQNNSSGLFEIDFTKPNTLKEIILDIQPDEIYHLAAYHFSSQKDGNSNMPFEPFNSINLLTTYEILETIRLANFKSRFFYASSCQIFGKVDHYPQSEKTQYKPDSFYGITKVAGNELCKFYREYYGIYASVGILYNHESVRRPLSFVTTKIAEAAAKAFIGIPEKLFLRDLEAIVDWGSAEDYVKAIWLTLQHSSGDDYIISSGIPRTVNYFSKIAFESVGLNWQNFVFQDSTYIKNAKLPYLGDCSKIRKQCCWEQKISFESLVEDMVKFHISRLTNSN